MKQYFCLFYLFIFLIWFTNRIIIPLSTKHLMKYGSLMPDKNTFEILIFFEGTTVAPLKKHLHTMTKFSNCNVDHKKNWQMSLLIFIEYIKGQRTLISYHITSILLYIYIWPHPSLYVLMIPVWDILLRILASFLLVLTLAILNIHIY